MGFSRPESIQVVEGVPEIHDTLWLLHRPQWPLSAHAQLVLQHLQKRYMPIETTTTLGVNSLRAARYCMCNRPPLDRAFTIRP
jgi:hypothetical protein